MGSAVGTVLHPVRDWLKANSLILTVIMSTVALSYTIVNSATAIAYTVIHWADTRESQIINNSTAITGTQSAIKKAQDDIVALDRQINDLKLRVSELHAESKDASAFLRARLDVIDALGRFAAERATQAPLPSAFVPPKPKGTRP